MREPATEIPGAGGSVLGRRNCQCKGPVAEGKLVCSRRAGRPAGWGQVTKKEDGGGEAREAMQSQAE